MNHVLSKYKSNDSFLNSGFRYILKYCSNLSVENEKIKKSALSVE